MYILSYVSFIGHLAIYLMQILGIFSLQQSYDQYATIACGAIIVICFLFDDGVLIFREPTDVLHWSIFLYENAIDEVSRNIELSVGGIVGVCFAIGIVAAAAIFCRMAFNQKRSQPSISNFSQRQT